MDESKTELIFTPAGILDLFSQIEELAEYDLGLTETLEGTLQLTIGDSIYEIVSTPIDIQMDPSDFEDLEQLNEETYKELSDENDGEIIEPIESGLIKELAKTLLVGGVARAAKKWLKD